MKIYVKSKKQVNLGVLQLSDPVIIEIAITLTSITSTSSLDDATLVSRQAILEDISAILKK